MKTIYIMRLLTCSFLIVIFLDSYVYSQENQNNKQSKSKTRIIIQSDAERDDQNSLCRLLLYANEIEILGIFYNTTGGGAYDAWARERFEAYGEIRENLLIHSDGYPTKEYLLERLKRHDEPGVTDTIINILLDDDPRPVWYLIWGPGGELVIGDVMKSLKQNYSEQEQDKALDKLRLFSIWSQSLSPCCGEDGISPWFPGKVFTINSKDQFKAIAYRNDWKNTVDYCDAYYISDEFQANFENHGALSDYYLGPGANNHRTLEGDSPSFLHVLPVGLRSLEHPSYGGWGGRFTGPLVDGMHYVGTQDMDANLESRLYKPISRWFEGMQNDYAARCDWAIASSYDSANHEPVAFLQHAEDLKASPGETVTLSAIGSSDPDGDELSFKWWQYKDADSYEGEIIIENNTNPEANFVFPEDGNGKDIHIILDVQDDGKPNLTRYRRVIVTSN